MSSPDLSLADRVAAITDRLAIDDLLTGYAALLDSRDWDGLRDLFTVDATFDFTAAYGIAAGRDEFVDWMSGQVTREFAPEIQHHFTNRRFVATGPDTVNGDVDSLNPDVIVGPDGERFLLVNGGRYQFSASRTPEGWRLTRLVGTVLWSFKGDLFNFELSGE